MSTVEPVQPIKTLPLVFDEPRGRKKPPRHLADLDEAGRKALLEEMGLPGFRARQLSTHYFGRLVDDPTAMTQESHHQGSERGLIPRRPPGVGEDAPRRGMPRR